MNGAKRSSTSNALSVVYVALVSWIIFGEPLKNFASIRMPIYAPKVSRRKVAVANSDSPNHSLTSAPVIVLQSN